MHPAVLVQVGIQAEAADLEEVIHMREELPQLRALLAEREAELERVRVTTKVRHAKELEQLGDEITKKERARARVQVNELQQKLENVRASYNSMVANKRAELARDLKEGTEDALEQAKEEYRKEVESTMQRLSLADRELHEKKTLIATLEAEKAHLQTQLEVQAIAFERADYDPIVKQLREELEQERTICSALRYELGNRERECGVLHTANQHVQSVVTQLEQALDRERAERRAIQHSSIAEKKQLKADYETDTHRLQEELDESRLRGDALYQDYERECQITEILVARHKKAVEELKNQNKDLTQSVRRTRWQKAGLSMLNKVKQSQLESGEKKGGEKEEKKEPGLLSALKQLAEKKKKEEAAQPAVKQSVHARLSQAELGKGLTSVPKHAPNPVTVREKLMGMSSMREHLSTVQVSVKEKTEEALSLTASPRSHRRAIASESLKATGPARKTLPHLMPYGQIPDLDVSVDWRAKK